MSYQNQSNKDHLDIIIGPPGQERLIDSLYICAEKHNMSIDEAWSKHIENKADNLMKPFLSFDSFSDIFTVFLGEDIFVQDYFLSHYYAFSSNGMLMARIKNPEDRNKYTAPALNFQTKNLIDVNGNPINIRRFDSGRRKQIQELFMLIFNASWAYVTISYDYMPIKKGAK
jgi:hypothetical protein